MKIRIRDKNQPLPSGSEKPEATRPPIDSSISLLGVPVPDNPENVALGETYLDDNAAELRRQITLVRDFVLQQVGLQSLALENGVQDAREVMITAFGEEPDLTEIVSTLRRSQSVAMAIQSASFAVTCAGLPDFYKQIILAVCLDSKTSSPQLSVDSLLKKLEHLISSNAPRVERPAPKPSKQDEAPRAKVRK